MISTSVMSAGPHPGVDGNWRNRAVVVVVNKRRDRVPKSAACGILMGVVVAIEIPLIVKLNIGWHHDIDGSSLSLL